MHIFSNPPPLPAKALLTRCGLPTEDLTEAHFKHFFGCGPQSEPAGVVGLEVHGACGLLRSLAVAEEVRGTGCARRLVLEVEQHARRLGVREVYLLTSTARVLFESLGYTTIPRESAPPSIRATREFSALCPDTATLMRKVVAA